ncbi:MAG: hypothetical protein VB025_12265 [Sphaerochaeta sp.]|nr:hypothetical protein [Sphaerochaeta sp.]
MNYFELLDTSRAGEIRVGIIGANGGFGYSFLAQIPMIPSISLRVMCDLDAEKSLVLLNELGYDSNRFHLCRTADDIAAALLKDDAILILEHSRLLSSTDIDVLVESTGVPEVSAYVAEDCLLNGIHVCMVSKETDSVAGPYLHDLAQRNNLIYTIVNGDQPGNLVQLYSWAKTLGLEIIAAGKSSEYDFIYDPQNGMFEYLGDASPIPEFASTWTLEGPQTLVRRRELLKDYPQSAVPDYCEMNVVSNITGLLPACDAMHYPICRVEELADVFIPIEDGGILEKTGVVDVFINLRRPDEASFAGGVFIIVTCHNEQVWDLLKEKGHIVSRNKKYACMDLPYHFMGVEAPMSVLLASLKRMSGSQGCHRVSKMVGTTVRDFSKGELLEVNGHHHVIEGVDVSLVPHDSVGPEVIPFYLMAGKTLSRDIPKDTVLTLDMLDTTNSTLLRML